MTGRIALRQNPTIRVLNCSYRNKFWIWCVCHTTASSRTKLSPVTATSAWFVDLYVPVKLVNKVASRLQSGGLTGPRPEVLRMLHPGWVFSLLSRPAKLHSASAAETTVDCWGQESPGFFFFFFLVRSLPSGLGIVIFGRTWSVVAIVTLS